MTRRAVRNPCPYVCCGPFLSIKYICDDKMVLINKPQIHFKTMLRGGGKSSFDYTFKLKRNYALQGTNELYSPWKGIEGEIKCSPYT